MKDVPPRPATARTLHLSGILVRVRPGRLADAVEALRGLDGVEVHHQEASSGKIVVTHEARTREEAERALRGIQALPMVHLAEPVYHHVEDDAAGRPSNPLVSMSPTRNACERGSRARGAARDASPGRGGEEGAGGRS